MNWEAVGAIGEIVGAFAVVLTLIYLASQTKLNRKATEQNTQALRSSARTEASRYWSEETIRLALSPDMASIVDQGMIDASELSDNERQRLVSWYTQHLIAKDALFHQHRDGTLPDDAWEAHKLVLIGVLGYDSFIRTWDAGFIPVSPEFKAYVEDLRANRAESTWSFDAKARIFDTDA